MDQLLGAIGSVITTSTAGTTSLLNFALIPVAGFVLALTVFIVVATLVRTRVPGAIKKAAGMGRKGRGRRFRR